MPCYAVAISIVILLAALPLTGCGHEDVISRIVKEESANQHFSSGMFIPIRLPETASAAEVASAALGLSAMTNVTVLETRNVQIPAGSGFPPGAVNYTALMVDTSSGKKVVLLKFIKSKVESQGGWWHRVYNLE